MMMKTAALAFLLLAQEEDPAVRIQRALDWYADADSEVRELGRRELQAIGAGAIPYLEKLLELRNATDVYRLIRSVEKQAQALQPRWVTEADLPDWEEIDKKAPKVERKEAERYVQSKLKEAHAAARAGNFQRGYDVANALMILEPRSQQIEEIRKLRRYCDNMITQTSLVRCRVVAPAAAGTTPGKHEFTLRMENMFRGAIRVVYDRGGPVSPTTPVVEVSVLCEELFPNGTSNQKTRWFEVAIDHEVPIALGAQWERAFTLDAGEDFAEEQESIRLYTISAMTQPTRIECGMGNVQRRINFEPVTFKVVPKKYEFMIAEPLAMLDKAVAAGTVNEVFMAALLAGEKEKPQVVGKLVTILEKSETQIGRDLTAFVLIAVTGQKLGSDPKRWREYADGLASAAAKPAKK